MKKTLLSTLALVALVAFSFAGDKAKDKSAAGPKPGDMAPAFSLTDQNGQTVTSDQLKGKIVVLEWFNNECPYVVKFYKGGQMNDWASKYHGKDVVWLAINSTSGKTVADNKAISSEWKIQRPILNDAAGEVGKAYGSKNTPTMYIIDKDGKIAYRGAIDNNSDASPSKIDGATNYVAKALDEMLAGKPVSEPMTKAYGCSVKYAN
ncbi:MAG: redoxin domain-containing protein [Anaerolineae bacterium]|nr:redoxin domain-containing protein [Phycisphaerae bacterium]